LLVSDDPDDHHAFTEAIGKMSDNLVVLIVIDALKAEKLLLSKVHLPEFLIIDISVDGFDVNTLLDSIQDDVVLSRIPTLTYGERSQFEQIVNRNSVMFFLEEDGFSKLQSNLRDFIEGRLN
jgi:hypothetical protein